MSYTGNTRPVGLLYRQEGFPVLQNRTYATVAEARSCPRGDIVLVEDQRSGIVRNTAFLAESVSYDLHYQNEQALSPYFHQHLSTVATIIARTMGKQALIEVGCGKAFFLEMLNSTGFDVSGFDLSYEGHNPRVQRGNFDPTIGTEANGVILRHVLEHIPEPVEFLQELKNANGGRGRIYIEVPCFDWIIAHRAWYDIFYEHVNYFRLTDFRRMFGKIFECGRLFGDQYLYIVADLATLREPKTAATDHIHFPDDFIDGIYSGPPTAPGHAAVWGGASKGVIFSLLRERHGHPIDTVIDINPAKQGQYLPATGLLVCSPAQALSQLPSGSTIYVMNPNYLEEIKEMAGNAFIYVGASSG